MKTQSFPKLFLYVALCCTLVFAFGLMAGCKGSDGSNGTNAATTGTVSGTVTTSVGSVALAGVAVTTNPVVSGATATTAADGSYTLSLPGGSYTLTFAKANYTSATANVNVANGIQTPANATLAEAASGKPSVAVVASGNNVGYGQDFTVTATATSPLGATLTYSWTGLATVSTTNTGTATSQAATFTPSKMTSSGSSDNTGGAFGGATATTSDPGGYISPYAINPRFEVLPINADTRGAKSVTVKVDDGQGGTTSASVTVNSAAPNPGVKQVAIGNAIYMNSGITATTSTWSLTIPDGTAGTISTVTGTTRIAYFTPAVEGKYVVTVNGKSLNVFAGKYVGAITGGGYTTQTFSKTDAKAGMWFDTTAAYWWGAGQSSATYTNWPTVTQSGACNLCHDGATAIDMWAPWSQTAHATFFSRGLEGITSNSASCVTCHTVGSDGVNVANGGYDDLAASTGFVYTKGIGAWSKMTTSYPTVAAVANIQCENCHGAQSTLAGANSGHKTAGSVLVGQGTYSTAVRVSHSSEVCGTCHSSGTGHHFFSEWENLNPDNGRGHGKKSVAISHPNCACHSSQAFVTKLSDTFSGAYYGLGSYQTWTTPEAEPITCTACHDPHDATNPNQLRVYNSYSTPNWSGFTVDGLGKGAICTKCHSQRFPTKCANDGISSVLSSTGTCSLLPTSTQVILGVPGNIDARVVGPAGVFLHEDTESYTQGGITYNGTPELYSNAHDASQADVLMGRNAYFMGNSLPMLSKHANVEDSCVGCHLVLNPQTHLSHGAPAVSSHVMYIAAADKATLCANCHGATVDGEALAAQVDDLMTNLQTAIAANFKRRVLLGGPTVTLYYVSNWSTPTGTFVVPVVINSATTVTANATSAAVYISGTSRNFNSLVTSSIAPWTPFITPADRLNKAVINGKMLSIDDSEGVHNPSFVLSVLNNTIGAMKTDTP